MISGMISSDGTGRHECCTKEYNRIERIFILLLMTHGVVVIMMMTTV